MKSPKETTERINVRIPTEQLNKIKEIAKNRKSPFAFVDMSVKDPWDSQWKTNCRTKIKGCDGMIALVSKNTAASSLLPR